MSNTKPNHKLKYVLVTPARNEEDYIGKTMASAVAQTVLPEKWVIVSDGSTDRTDEIVKEYAAEHSWIELVRMPERRDRQFAAKVHAFNAGYARLDGVQYDIIGNLDADLSFDPDYFEFVLSKFACDEKLGVCGTPWCEDAKDRSKHTYSHRFAQLEHVSGACQMFRKECFKNIGGYTPIKGGSIDWVAVTTARMKGWNTRTFLEKTTFHHRQLGTGNHSPLMVYFRYGQKAYRVGGDPLWEFLRGVFQMRLKPWVLGGIYYQVGYFWSLAARMERPISNELIEFHRREQRERLRQMVDRYMGKGSTERSDETASAPANGDHRPNPSRVEAGKH
jgi:glycosyltransferase involved in cell wall biosynthesis